ncbi:MAG: hypothetical protein ACRCZD_03940, partial [Phycicoccus sp.]
MTTTATWAPPTFDRDAVVLGAERAVRQLLVALLMLLLAAAAVHPRADSTRAVVHAFELARTAPMTVVALGWAVVRGADLHVRGGMVMASGMDGGYGPRQGVAVGHVFLTGTHRSDIGPELVSHEVRHARQWVALGPSMPIM